jgi:hypothetical protein
MSYASYQLRRLAGPIWAWRANYHNEASQIGYAFGRAAARRAARTWLRGKRRSATDQPAPSGRLHAPVD